MTFARTIKTREEILYLWGTGVTEREEILWGTSVTECQRGQEDDRRGRLKRQCAGQSSQNLYSKVQFLRGFWWLCGWFGDILRNKLSNYFFSGAKSYLYSLLYSTLISTLCYPPGRLLNHPHNCSWQNSLAGTDPFGSESFGIGISIWK